MPRSVHHVERPTTGRIRAPNRTLVQHSHGSCKDGCGSRPLISTFHNRWTLGPFRPSLVRGLPPQAPRNTISTPPFVLVPSWCVCDREVMPPCSCIPKAVSNPALMMPPCVLSSNSSPPRPVHDASVRSRLPPFESRVTNHESRQSWAVGPSLVRGDSTRKPPFVMPPCVLAPSRSRVQPYHTPCKRRRNVLSCKVEPEHNQDRPERAAYVVYLPTIPGPETISVCIRK